MDMNFFKRYAWLIITSIFVLLLAAGVLAVNADKTAPITVIVESNGVKEVITPWYDDESKINYVFLPSYAGEYNTEINVYTGVTVYKDGVEIKDESELFSTFKTGVLYTLKTESDRLLMKSVKIQFEKADNVSATYISTATGSMKEIYNNKEHKEPARITVCTKDGAIDIKSANVTLSGHGNSTWKEDKKAYTLVFDEKQGLLGMEGSSKWILLANARDKTNIKNKMVFDFARKENMPYSPESDYTMLYINGRCLGLFLLSQSVNTTSERLAGSDDNFYLCKFELPERLEEDRKIKFDDIKLNVERVFPKKITEEEEDLISQKVAGLNDAIADCAVNQGNLGEYIDLDSWTKKYLVDEIFENYDAAVASSYFYWQEGKNDNLIYAGPIWDYDGAMGSTYAGIKNPACLFAIHESRTPKFKRPWYSLLCSNKDFYTIVKDTYRNELSSELGLLISEYIPREEAKISSAVKSDEIRWKYDSSTYVSDLEKYLSERKLFLDSYWGNEDRYCVVRYFVQDTTDYKYVYVPYGKTIFDSAYVDSVFSSDQYTCVVTDTKEKFDVRQNITEDYDITIKKVNLGKLAKLKNLFSTKLYLMIPITMFILIVVPLILLLRERLEGAEKYEKRKR